MLNTPTAKVSWLRHFGQVIGRVLGAVSKDAPTVIKYAEPVALALLPQFADEIKFADGVATHILKQITVTQAATSAIGNASGPDKLKTVTDAVGGEIDAWIQNNFPGSGAVSTIRKSNLIQAIYDIADEVSAPADGSAAALPPAPSPVNNAKPAPTGSVLAAG